MSEKIKNLFRDPGTAGFFALQALIAVGLIGILGLATLSLSRIYETTKREVDSQENSHQAILKLEMFFSDKSFCKRNIIQAAGGPTGLKIGQVTGGLSIQRLSFEDGSVFFEKSAGAGSELKISSLSVFPAKGDVSAASVSSSLYVAELRVELASEGRANGPFSIPLLMKVNGGFVQSCQAFPEETGRIELKGCKAGQFVRGIQAGALDCIDFPAARCPGGQRLVGVKANGGIRCAIFPRTP